MHLKWLHWKENMAVKCVIRVCVRQPATCYGCECACFKLRILDRVVTHSAAFFHSFSARTNDPPTDFHTLASIGWDFNSTKFPVKSKALLFGLLKSSLDNFDQEEGRACTFWDLLFHVTSFQHQHLICFASNESEEQMGWLLDCTTQLSISECLLSLRRCRCCSDCRKIGVKSFLPTSATSVVQTKWSKKLDLFQFWKWGGRAATGRAGFNHHVGDGSRVPVGGEGPGLGQQDRASHLQELLCWLHAALQLDQRGANQSSAYCLQLPANLLRGNCFHILVGITVSGVIKRRASWLLVLSRAVSLMQ